MKKIISIAIVCMMLLSVVNVLAADPAAINLGENQTVTDVTSTITVPINIASLGFDAVAAECEYDEENEKYNVLNPDEAVGMMSIQIYLDYDKNVLKYASKANGTIKMPGKTLTGTRNAVTITEKEDYLQLSIATPSELDLSACIYDVGTLLNLNFKVVEGCTAKEAVITPYNCKWYANDNYEKEYHPTATPLTITLPSTDTTPDLSTVRTYPKRMWDAEKGELTTLGIITVGKDFDTIEKYGINIAKDGTTNGVNYWTESSVATNDGKEAYYAIGLNGISETTKIKASSESYAVLSNGVKSDVVLDADDNLPAPTVEAE